MDTRNTYERLLCILPEGGGKGTADDPKRPKFAPKPMELQAAKGSGIIGFAQVLSDDGKFLLVEFVARDHDAFRDILADKSVKAFLRGRDSRGAVEAELKKRKKNFDFTTVRPVYTPGGSLAIYIGDVLYVVYQDTAILGGQPGVGASWSPVGNSVSKVESGQIRHGRAAGNGDVGVWDDGVSEPVRYAMAGRQR